MKILVSALTTLIAPASLMASVTFDFNSDGITEGWAGTNVTGLDSAGGSLSGTASSNDPQLSYGSTIGLGAGESWNTLIFRVRETQDEDPAGVLTEFNSTGAILIINGTNFGGGFSSVDSGDGFFTASMDISSIGTNAINSVRLDPIGGASSNSNSQTSDNLFEVDFITLDTIPEPSIALLGGLGFLGLLRRRRA